MLDKELALLTRSNMSHMFTVLMQILITLRRLILDPFEAYKQTNKEKKCINYLCFYKKKISQIIEILCVFVCIYFQNWNEMEYAIVQLLVFLIFCFTDLGTSIYRHITDQHDQIGYMAHLSGAVAGLLVGIGVLRNLEVRRWERILWWIAVIFYFSLMMTGILIHIFLPDYFPRQEYN